MSKRIICEVCQTEYNSDEPVCPVCDTPQPVKKPAQETTNAPWKKAAVAALGILFVLFAAFIVYEFLYGQTKSALL